MVTAADEKRFENVIHGYTRGMFAGVCRLADDRETVTRWVMEELHNSDLPEPVKRLIHAAHIAAIAHDAYDLPTHDGMF